MERGAWMCAALLAALVVLLRVYSPGVLEMADGDYHYLFARWSWAHPELLLDHWAKPLFTLLASPFAQLGLWGVTLFNAGLAFVAARLCIALVQRDAPGAGWAVPVLLFCAPAFLYVLLAGMTEALFAVLTIVVVWCLVRERYVPGAIVASFVPLARPEHVAFMPAVFAWLVWKRQWRALPWLACGLLVYSLIGWPVFHDPLWFFHNDPYPGNDIYGSGAFSHFWDQRDAIAGEPLRTLFLLSCAIMAALIVVDRERREDHLRMSVLAAAPAIAMWLAHSYVWWKGGHGSMGLIRVLATSLPLMVLFTVHALAAAWRRWVPAFRWRWVLGAVALLVLANWCVNDVRGRMQLPVPANAMQRTVERAADRIRAVRAPGQRLAYLFPHIGVHAGVDPWDTADARIIYFLDWDRPDWGMRDGDLLAWDAQLCPKDGGMPLEHLLNEKNFILENVFVPDVQTEVFGLPFEIWLFRRGAAVREQRIDTLFDWEERAAPFRGTLQLDTAACANGPCLRGLEIKGVLIPSDSAVVTELELHAVLEGAAATKAEYTEEGSGRSWSERPSGDTLHLVVHVPGDARPAMERVAVQIPDSAAVRVRSLTVIARAWYQRRGW